jgi:hypothetical protein
MKGRSKLERYGLAMICCGVALAVAWPIDAPSSCFLLAHGTSDQPLHRGIAWRPLGGLPMILHAAQAFTSPFPPKLRLTTDGHSRSRRV